jgi:hypothetical protein
LPSRPISSVHQAVVNDNHDIGNTSPILYTGIVFPLVAIVLYVARERAGRRVTRAAADAGDAAVGRGQLGPNAL